MHDDYNSDESILLHLVSFPKSKANNEYIDLKVIIATTGLFPKGFAATNRLMAYYKGLTSNNVNVIGISAKSFSRPYSANINGYWNVDGVSCLGPTNLVPERGKVFRRINRLYGRLYFCMVLIREIMRKETDAVIFSGRCLWVELIITGFCKYTKTLILKEESENPAIYPNEYPGFLASLWSKFTSKTRYELYHGLLLMTTPLMKYFLERGYPANRLKLIPHTVLLERFDVSILKPPLGDLKYLAFTGTLSEPKDGILSLLYAFKIVVDEYPDISLIIAGSGTKYQIQTIQEKITELGLADKAKFVGEIPGDDIPALICHAIILVSARPPSLQAEYGFPTKIVEYMATGRPIVTTSYGDLNNYLSDNQNAFIASSSNPKVFSAKIMEALGDSINANNVGNQGRELAKKCFNPISQTKLIINFIDELKIVNWKSCDTVEI